MGWDNAVKPPDDNELGWKDTIRMNPLEDIIVALRPKSQNLPFTMPNSIRPLDVTTPVGTTGQFSNVDPLTGNPITVTNAITNFGWEYVWHCHLLGHEENDMMRPMVFQPAAAPTLKGTNKQATVNLSWTASTTPGVTGYTLQRATNSAFTTGLTTLLTNAPQTAFVDTLTVRGTYYYRVQAVYSGYMPWSNTVSVKY